jgi:hypothetical protein
MLYSSSKIKANAVRLMSRLLLWRIILWIDQIRSGKICGILPRKRLVALDWRVYCMVYNIILVERFVYKKLAKR